MKFRVGERVKFVKSTIYHTDDVKIGEIYKIIRIDNLSKSYQVENAEVFNEEELVKADYTYEDLKKAPVGTKITFEKGKVLIRENSSNEKDCLFYNSCSRSIKNLKGLKDITPYSTLGKIIKIEEPTYQTVYEANKEILDEAEKRYLRGVVRPYKDVKSIQKYIFFDKKLAKIQIFVLDIRGTGCWSIDLPPFEKNAMYKNMEDNKDYTLEELGL